MASLSRLVIADEKIAPLAEELNGILAHMEVLRQVQRDPAPEDGSFTDRPCATWRADVVESPSASVSLESFAPATRDGFFLVPRLATHDQPAASDGSPEPS